MTIRAAETDAIEQLRAALGDEAVRRSKEDIIRMLKDNSWLSPIVAEELDRRSEQEGSVLGIAAVVAPRTEQDVLLAAQIAARHRLPITPRGGGTSNFGLLTPEQGGLIFDLRALTGDCTLEDGTIRAPAGVMQGAMEREARSHGRELPVLTTTYATATIGGWVAGGHVGLGSGVHGAVWDDVVRELRLVTVEEEPRTLVLTGHDADPVLHTFGTVGLVTEVTFRTEQAREWVEALAFFPTFDLASQFVSLLSQDVSYYHRALTAQEEALMPAFKRPLGAALEEGAGVLMIVDEAQLPQTRSAAEALSGRFVEWQKWQLSGGERPSVAAMVYGHRMLWVKRFLPEAAFLHVYFDPDDPDAGAGLLKERFGDQVLLETKFVRSPWLLRSLGYAPAGTLPAAVITIVDGGMVHDVMRFCDDEGIRYQNPHTSVLEDNGVFPDVTPIVELKYQADPYNLLNPGKLRSARTRTTLRGLDHVALGVPNLDLGIDIFVRSCGMKLLYTNIVPASGRRMAMLHDAAGKKLELIERPGDDIADFRHIAFRADDADEAHQALLAQGWHTKREPHDLPRAGARTALLNGYGFDLQVISYADPPPGTGDSAAD